MKKSLFLLYGLIGYIIGGGAYFVGLSGFIAGFLGDYSINAGRQADFVPALAINIALMVLFGLPHSLMARRGFKARWQRIIPPALERSTYMMQAGLLAILMITQWRAMPQTIWHVQQPVLNTLLWGLYWTGWLIAATATFLINHFELTGLQQVYAYMRGRQSPPPTFRIPLLYRVVRHPMQLGMMIALWSAPHMTVGRLVFAAGMTTYILIGLYFEERDLVRNFGDNYRAYQRRTPQLLPLPRRMRRSLQTGVRLLLNALR